MGITYKPELVNGKINTKYFYWNYDTATLCETLRDEDKKLFTGYLTFTDIYGYFEAAYNIKNGRHHIYYDNGKVHRYGGPAWYWESVEGSIFSAAYWLYGKMVNEMDVYL